MQHFVVALKTKDGKRRGNKVDRDEECEQLGGKRSSSFACEAPQFKQVCEVLGS